MVVTSAKITKQHTLFVLQIYRYYIEFKTHILYALCGLFVKSRNFITLYVAHNFTSRYIVHPCKLCRKFEDKFRVKFANIIVVSQEQH